MLMLKNTKNVKLIHIITLYSIPSFRLLSSGLKHEAVERKIDNFTEFEQETNLKE